MPLKPFLPLSQPGIDDPPPFVVYRRHNLYPASIHVGRNAWIGSNAAILTGATIGDNAIVATGAAVNKSGKALIFKTFPLFKTHSGRGT